MAKDVQIRIIATDQASQTFKNVGEAAASSAATAEQANQKAARSYEEVEKRAQAVGAAIGVAAAGISYASQAATDHARVIDSVGRVYKDQADEIMNFSKELQANTNISDEAGRQAALTAATLQKSYGLTTAEIEKLIERSADLAQMSGRELSDVIERTSSAVRGEAESVEILGVTLNDTYVASQAAARGLTGWNTTMSDSEKAAFRLSLLLEQTSDSTGAAADAAQGMRGDVIDLTQALNDGIVAFGNWTGGMGEALGALGNMALILPVVGAGIGKLLVGSGALVGGGALAGAGALGMVAAIAGGGYLAYDAYHNAGGVGGSHLENWTNQGLSWIGGKVPGTSGLKGFAEDNERLNELELMLSQMFVIDPRAQQTFDSPADVQDYLIGRVKQTDLNKYQELSDIDIAKAVYLEASKHGMSVEYYLRSTFLGTGSYLTDPTTGSLALGETYGLTLQDRYFQGGGNLTSGATTMAYGTLGQRPSPYGEAGWFDPWSFGHTKEFSPEGQAHAQGGSGAVANSLYLSAGDPVVLSPDMETAKRHQEIALALGVENAAYIGLVEGINSASDAQSAFWQTQQNVLGGEAVYSQQLGEYTAQVNAQDAAYEILNGRREEGQALSQAELDFLDNYAEANERGTGAIEDATVAQGLLAQQYLLNMEQGDAMNQILAGQAEATGGLTRAIQDMILMMDGVPEEVRTQIMLDRADESIADLIAYYNYLSSIPGYVSTTIETRYVVTGNDGETRFRGAQDGMTAYSDGGTVHAPLMPAFANGGTWAMVGERGPEAVYLSRGDQVFNTEATKSMLSGGGRGGRDGRIVFNNANIYLTPQTANLYGELNQYLIASARGG